MDFTGQEEMFLSETKKQRIEDEAENDSKIFFSNVPTFLVDKFLNTLPSPDQIFDDQQFPTLNTLPKIQKFIEELAVVKGTFKIIALSIHHF